MIRSFLELAPDLDSKAILVKGGTGSLDKAFVRTVLQRFKPSHLIIFSRDKLKQHGMKQDLGNQEYPCRRYFISDVCDQAHLETAIAGVDYVVYTAASSRSRSPTTTPSYVFGPTSSGLKTSSAPSLTRDEAGFQTIIACAGV